MSRPKLWGCALASALCCTPAFAQTVEIPEIQVDAAPSDLAPPPIRERYQLPQTSASTTAARIEQTTNAVDAGDTIKYLPSLLVRKRNNGDFQQVLGTRNWGINSSARSLVYADDILLTPLIGNNNTSATPRWGMVSPEQIARVDMLYGPYSAAYSGNSIGGVLIFTTKMPDKAEASLKQSESFQTFDFYNTKDTYRTDQTSMTFGNRWNDLSVFVGATFQNSFSQPISWVTSANTGALPAGTTGVIAQPNRTNTGAANVLGASGLLHTQQMNVNAKAALDITPWLRASYTLGLWSNDQDSSAATYLKDAAGNPTFGGPSVGAAFASGTYTLNQLNMGHALSLKSDTGGAFDFDFVVTRFDYITDIQRSPFTVTASGTGFINTGKIARLDGTNWTTADAKGIWRTAGPFGPHEVSFGVHGDYNVLNNPTYQTPTWNAGPDSTSTLYSRGDGKTQTVALWAQDAWRFAPQFKLTTGLRWETWRAFDGYNTVGSTATNSATGAITSTSTFIPPDIDAARTSPKASLSWEPNANWTLTASFGVANRFPTVGELYQVVTIGTTLTNPNPNLKPETAYSEEIAIERKWSDGKVRLSLFQDDTYDALIAQSTTGAGTTTGFVTNVDHVRNRGIELAWQKDHVFVDRLEVFGSVTYVDSVIVSDPSFLSTNPPGTTATGKRAPNVPAWRTTLGATYRATEAWAFTAVGRYQSKIYATLDNTDWVANVYQSFDPFFVVDLRAHYKVSQYGSISVGVDNVNNAKYHLFHPFPQRTFVVQGKLTY